MSFYKIRSPIPSPSPLWHEKEEIIMPHADALVVTTMISKFRIHRILVTIGSLIDIFFYKAFKQMHISKDWLQLVNILNVDLIKNHVTRMGIIHMTLMVGEKLKCDRIKTNWLVVDCEMSYNAIMEKPSLATLQAAISLH